MHHSISSVFVVPYVNCVGAHDEAVVDGVGDEATIKLHHSFGVALCCYGYLVGGTGHGRIVLGKG